eukprot:scaffold10020_cov161-Skeletonema_marinoi.AAC.10
MMVGRLLQEDHEQNMWKYCLLPGGLSAALSAVCGRYGIEVRKEGVPKSFFGQVLGEGIGVGTVVLRSLIGVGRVSSSSMVCVDILARVAVTVTYWEMPVQDLRAV